MPGRGGEQRTGAQQGREGAASQNWTEGPGMEPLEGHKGVLERFSRVREGEQEGEAGETAGERSEVGG